LQQSASHTSRSHVNSPAVFHTHSTSSSFDLWHFRLGHISSEKIKLIQQTCSDIHCTFVLPCDICPVAKQNRLPFPLNVQNSNAPFDLIHVDIWGPYSVCAIGGYHDFLTVVDDFTSHLAIPNKT